MKTTKKKPILVDEPIPQGFINVGKRIAGALGCDPRHLRGFKATNTVRASGIDEGDILLIRKTTTPNDGDTVLVHDSPYSYHLGVMSRRGGHIVIKPIKGSRRMASWLDDPSCIYGVLAGVLKK